RLGVVHDGELGDVLERGLQRLHAVRVMVRQKHARAVGHGVTVPHPARLRPQKSAGCHEVTRIAHRVRTHQGQTRLSFARVRRTKLNAHALLALCLAWTPLITAASAMAESTDAKPPASEAAAAAPER